MVTLDNVWGNPLEIWYEWFLLATAQEPNDPNAAALATSAPSGIPSVRMVLIKGVDERGFRFFTNVGSRKGMEMEANPNAALCLHWKSLKRQVRVEGTVSRIGIEETAAYFHSRSRRSQIASAVSLQSQPLPSRDALEEAHGACARELCEREVPLPVHWTGFIVTPTAIEFWQEGPDRLHDRLRFTLLEGQWRSQRLYP